MIRRRRLSDLEARVAELEAQRVSWSELPPRYDHAGEPLDAQVLWRGAVADYERHVDVDEWSGYL